MRTIRLSSLLLAWTLLFTSLLAVNRTRGAAVAPTAGEDRTTALAAQLRGGDPRARDAALAEIRDMARRDPTKFAPTLRTLLQPLLDAKYYEDVVQLTSNTILAQPASVAVVADEQHAKTCALIALGKHEEALVAAKTTTM